MSIPMAQCANCGAPLTPDAQFCSKCGTPVAGRPVTATTRPQRSTWWIVPSVIVGLVVIAWLVLAGLPFGREQRVVTTETTETIAEGTTYAPPEPTGTVVDLTTEEPPFATQTIPTPIPTQSIPTQTVPPITQTQPAPQPPPVIVEERNVPPEPVPTTREPEPPPEETRDEISESEAAAALRGHLAAANPYDGVSQRCLQLRSVGYRNVGYTFSVWDSCVAGGGTRMLGRWRVDAKSGEVFRQGDDGRYQ